MKRLVMIAAILTASMALTACDDGSIYGNYENKAYGVSLELKPETIIFKGQEFKIKKWDDSKKPVYTAFAKLDGLGSWNFTFKKVKGGVEYQGVKFDKE